MMLLGLISLCQLLYTAHSVDSNILVVETSQNRDSNKNYINGLFVKEDWQVQQSIVMIHVQI